MQTEFSNKNPKHLSLSQIREEAYKQGYEDAKKEIEDAEVYANWLMHSTNNGDGSITIRYTCSSCYALTGKQYPYCPACRANMLGEHTGKMRRTRFNPDQFAGCGGNGHGSTSIMKTHKEWINGRWVEFSQIPPKTTGGGYGVRKGGYGDC